MKELLKIEQELKEIIEEGNRRISEYQEEIRTAKENEEDANKEVIRAKQGSDPVAYSKAIEDKQTASNIADYYKGKIEELKAKPYITEGEYKVYTDRIKAEMDSINNGGRAKVIKLFEELGTIKEEVVPAYTKANNLLSELQNNIYKRSYEKVIEEAKENKTSVNTKELHNEYKDNSLTSGIDYILKSQVIEKIREGSK